MAQRPDLGFAIGLPPEKAIQYFQSKGYDYSFDWYEMWQGAHTKAFTVAKAMQMDVLEDLREWVDKAIKDGITLREFQLELAPRLQKRGWWGREVVPHPSGGLTVAELGSPTRLETIYRTNTQVAYNVGRYKEQVEDIDDRPYWQYVAVMDTLTRPTHAALNGKVFKATDPFWHTHYPPNGFNCRCRVRALTKEQVEAKGLEVLDGTDKLSEVHVEVAKGVVRPVTVFKGYGINMHPDPGWSYNPGMDTWKPQLPEHVPEVVKKFKTEIEGRGFAKEAHSTDLQGLNDILRNLANDTPGLFKRGFVSVQTVRPESFDDPRKKYFMATDSRGRIYLLDEDLHDYGGWNPARDTFKAMDKIKRGKKPDFNEEYSLEALWHEILHNRAEGKINWPEDRYKFDRIVMETVNQFVARHTYPSFLEALGGLEGMGARVLKQGYGYFEMVRNFRLILKGAGLDENNVLTAMNAVNEKGPWIGHAKLVAEALALEFGDIKWARQFRMALTLVTDEDPDTLPQRVREILLEN